MIWFLNLNLNLHLFLLFPEPPGELGAHINPVTTVTGTMMIYCFIRWG